MKVRLTNNQRRIDFFPDRILDISKKTLRFEKCRKACVDIIIVDRRYIKQLNYKFRSINRPTDVLAFELKSPLKKQARENFLGDVFICADVAKQYVESFVKKNGGIFTKPDKKDLITNELVLYAVHGILHLLGYSDETARSYKKMHKRQEDILTRILHACPAQLASEQAKSARRADRLNPIGFNLASRGNPKQISNAKFRIKNI